MLKPKQVIQKLLKALQFTYSSITVDHKRIVKGILLVSVFSLIGKFSGALKDATIAYKYGVGEVVDTYSIAFVYAIWIPMIFKGVLGSIYVPLIHKLSVKEREIFKNQLVGNLLVTSACLSVIFYFVLQLLLQRTTSNLSTEYLPTNTISLALAPIVGLSILSASFTVILLAEEKHANTLFEAIPSLAILSLVLLWPSTGSINPLIWGTLLGFALHCFCLYYFVRKSGTTLRPKLALDSAGWATLRTNFSIVVLGQFVMSCIDPVSYTIAEKLGAGSVSSLNYSTKLVMLFLTLGATAIARAILPVLSNTKRDYKQRLRLTIQWAIIAALAGIAASVFVWLWSTEIVKVVYERGAFTDNDTSAIARALQLGSLQFPFYFSGIVLAQLLISLGHYRTILLSAFLALVVKTIFSLALAPHMGFSGIIAANVPMYMANNVLFLVSLYLLSRQSSND